MGLADRWLRPGGAGGRQGTPGRGGWAGQARHYGAQGMAGRFLQLATPAPTPDSHCSSMWLATTGEGRER